MGNNYGPGVSRVLSPVQRQFLDVIWQQGKPPLDSELNLLQDMASNWSQIIVARGTPSGWLGNGMNDAAAFLTNAQWSNWFRFGRQRTGEQAAVEWAVVNGWLVPVTGTLTGFPPGSPDNTDTWNKITLNPPPSSAGDSRVDFVFLEVWLARVPPNPSTLNKPAASAIYTYGNVNGGMSFLPDDIQDPAIGAETTERVQLQYRIRVVSNVLGLTNNPDGFDPAVVFGQGAVAAPTSYNFQNMRSALGDPGLWRAGDGSSTAQTALGTVDGYSYAISLAGVFRRNSVSWLGDPSPNLNGGFNRNITAIDQTGVQTYSTVPTIATSLSATATSVALASVSNIPLPFAPSTPVLIQIGDELMTYTGITGTTLMGLTRGANSTRAEFHASGSVIVVQSGRPDGLFADQIAQTDVLDLRHAINPNGFDYDALLRYNFDLLLRGQLHANWKRSGASGPQGPFIVYQDKVVSTGGGVALGVTRLDGPDGIRTIFSDAAAPQSILLVVQPSSAGPIPPGPPVDVTAAWDLELEVNQTVQSVTAQWNPADALTIPIVQFQNGFPAGDSDQVRFINDGLTGAVVIRVDGQTNPLPPDAYTVTPANPQPNQDLVITFTSHFPTAATSALYITVQVQYGPGRGVGRRPDSFQGVAFENPSNPELIYRPTGVPYQYNPMHTGWSTLQSSFRNATYKSLIPVTSESYADPGSKTVVLTPFREIELPAVATTFDGTAANVNSVTPVVTSTTGHTGGTTAFRDTTVPVFSPTMTGFALVITNGPQPGRYTIVSVTLGGTFTVAASPSVTTSQSQVGIVNPTDTLFFAAQPSVPYTVSTVTSGTITLMTSYTGATGPTTAYDPFICVLDRVVWQPAASGLAYTVTAAQGLMPALSVTGGAKWGTTDPLQLFSNYNVSAGNPASTANLYVQVPRQLVPAWGEYHVPILPVDQGDFSEGINFMSLSTKGAPPRTDTDKNYVPYVSANGGGITFQNFSTLNLTTPFPPATYNAAFSYGGLTLAGMQFVDTRGLNRQGLQLPPFYGIARLWAVYEAHDYIAHGSAYNATTRTATGGGATNLLRQNLAGPTFWVEIDSDGDSTFILNANAIDITRSPNPITQFSTGNYVVEANVFGFDRGFFDLTQEARIVLTRPSPPNTGNGVTRAQAVSTTRTANIGAQISGLTSVLPGPLAPSDAVVINYTRTPYMGDAWGSQTNYIDIPYTPGPILSGNAYQIDSTTLNLNELTRPNQKLLEVLSSVGFVTTLGTGRTVGDKAIPPDFSIRDIGYEDPSEYPPTSSVEARPTTLAGDFIGDNQSGEVGSDYLGGSERLPLGALFRDKDFRGETFGGAYNPAPFALTGDVAVGFLGSLATSSSYEQTEVFVQGAELAVGQPGNLLVHVDGNQGNYALLTNFRVNRGGSVFNASGQYPGGEVAGLITSIQSPTGHTNVLCGRAFLVRNTVTDIGATEVSAGDELMLLIVTTVVRLTGTELKSAYAVIGTNGSGEGYSAADLYRISGHPLMVDQVRNDLNPSTIQLSLPALIGGH